MKLINLYGVLVGVLGTVAGQVAADETIVGGVFPDVRTDVASGTVTLTAADGRPIRLGDNFDPSLTNIARLVFWVDANANCVTNVEGAVTQWADVRETFADGVPTADHAFKYKRGLVYQPAEGSTDIGGLPPTFKTDARHPGMKFLDFGDYGSGRWMYLADPAGNILHQRAFTYYCVLGFDTPSNCGHLLADITSLDCKGTGTVFFHKGSGGSAAGPISTSTQDSCLYLGETRLDGARVDPRKTNYKWDRYQIFGQIGPGAQLKPGSDGTWAVHEPKFSTILNDRNIVFGSGYRQGGAVIGELLVWNEVLSERARRQVEAYLFAKWFGNPTAGHVVLASNAAFVFDTGATNVTVVAATGDGTLVKKGTGTLTLMDGAASDTAKLQVEEGRMAIPGGLSHYLPVRPMAGVKLTVGDRTLAATAATQSDKAELAGDNANGGSVTVDPSDLSGRKLRLMNAEMVLQPKAAASFTEEPALAEQYPNLLTNGSFEDERFSGTTYANRVQGWTVNDFVNTATYKSPWYGLTSEGVAIASTIPDGTQFVSIQGKGAAETGVARQTFIAPVTGLYRLSFWMTRRTSRTEKEGETIVSMLLDGEEFLVQPVQADIRGDINVFKRHSAVLPPLTKGAHELTITLRQNCQTDRAAVLDDIRLFPIAAGEYVNVPNSGMDSDESLVSAPWNNNGYLSGRAMIPGWSFSMTTNDESLIHSAGLTMHSSYWNWADSQESATSPLVDERKVYMQGFMQMETTVTLPRADRFRLSFMYGNRSNHGYPDNNGNERNKGHRVEAWLVNETTNLLVAAAEPTTPKMRICQSTAELPAGTYTLRIVNNMRGLTLDVAAIVDEVRLVYVDSESGMVPTTAFVNGQAVWKSVSLNTRFERDLETGRQKICMPVGAVARWNADIPSNGFYQVVFSASGRKGQRIGYSEFDYNGYTNAPVRFALWLDGDAAYRVLVMPDDTVRRYAVALPYLTGGAHTFKFMPVTTGSAENARLELVDFDVKPLSVAALPPEAVTKDVEIEAEDSAKIGLQYDGRMRIGKFKVNGKAYSGVLSAETPGLESVLSGPGTLLVRPVGLTILIR